MIFYQSKITGMNPKASFGKKIGSSSLRDSTIQNSYLILIFVMNRLNDNYFRDIFSALKAVAFLDQACDTPR
jgi:hypothetical protein